MARRPAMRKSLRQADWRQADTRVCGNQAAIQAATKGWEGLQYARTPWTLWLWECPQWQHGVLAGASDQNVA